MTSCYIVSTIPPYFKYTMDIDLTGLDKYKFIYTIINDNLNKKYKFYTLFIVSHTMEDPPVL